MYKLNDHGEAASEQRTRPRVAPLALLLVAILVTGCQSPPASRGADPRCVQMDPASKYAVYWSTGGVEAVEEIPSGLQRCVVAVAQAPSAPASSPTPGTPPVCSNGQVPSPAAAYYVDYYKDQPIVPLQIEDLRDSPPRCIKLVPDVGGGSSCPPPLGYHTVLINGVLYCVPK